MKNVLGMCLDRRVLTGLALVAIGIWVLAPQYILGALPLLLFAACPLSMLFMARMMVGSTDAQARPSAGDRLAALEREQAQLSTEIARTRAELGGADPIAASREA